jgi:ketosteroid isomerase-like protein
MASTQDVETLRAGYEAFNRRDFDALMELLDPDIEWRQDASVAPDADVFRGREGTERFFTAILSDFDHLEFVPEEIIDADDQVVVVVAAHGRGKASGAEVAAKFTHLWTIRDGKGVRAVFYADHAKALADAGLSPPR